MGCGQSKKIHLYPRKNKSKSNGKKGHDREFVFRSIYFKSWLLNLPSCRTPTGSRNKFSIKFSTSRTEKRRPGNMYGHGIVTTVNELLSINLPREPSSSTLTHHLKGARDKGIEKCEKCLRKTTEKGFFSPERFKQVLDLSACFIHSF